MLMIACLLVRASEMCLRSWAELITMGISAAIGIRSSLLSTKRRPGSCGQDRNLAFSVGVWSFAPCISLDYYSNITIHS
jgi:hypothetical protein